jgi:hypothetical protein
MAVRKKNSMAAGFTLIEVVFAVLILSASLVTLLGLQESSLQLSAHDRFTQRAMLYAREIMSPIETSPDPIETQDTDGTIEEILNQFSPVKLETTVRPLSATMFRAHIKVEDWGIPKVNEQAMKRITLTIRWSDSPLDAFQIMYFMPNEGDQSSKAIDEAP